jgi:outer membrane protein assembly factor BamB
MRRITRGAALPSRLLFATTDQGTIDIYPLKDPDKGGIIAQITGLTGDQQGMVVDASGDLFVANNGGFGNDFFISEYAPPYTSQPKILSAVWNGNAFYPVGVGVDANGTVYVSDCGAYCLETPAVYVYPPGATSPSQAITSPDFSSLAGLSLDANGNVYVLSWNERLRPDVFKMRAGSTMFRPMHLRGLLTANGGNGLSFDGDGNLYVAANSGMSNYVLEYKAGARNAFRVIRGLPLGSEPDMLDVGPDDNLYVANYCVGSPCAEVYGFRSKGNKPFEEIGVSQSSSTLGVATAPNLLLQKGKP